MGGCALGKLNSRGSWYMKLSYYIGGGSLWKFNSTGGDRGGGEGGGAGEGG